MGSVANLFKSRFIYIPVLLVVFIGFVVFSFQDRPEPIEQLYYLHYVEKNNLVSAVNAIGTLEPVMVVKIGTQISGTVKELFVDYNDKVQKGQVLLLLDDEQFRAKVNHSQGVLDSAKAKLKLAHLHFDRYQALHNIQAVATDEFDKVVSDYEIAKGEVIKAHAQLEIDEYNLKNTRIVSPVDGVVINRVVDVGQTVAASFQTPDLIEIAGDLTKMQIDANIVEADIGELIPDLEATFTVDAFHERIFTGAVKQVRLKSTNEQNVVTYHVIIDVDNPDLKLLPGMTAYVNIELYREDDVLLIPNSALKFSPSFDKKKYNKTEAEVSEGEKTGSVWVLKKGQLEKVTLVLGATNLRHTVARGNERLQSGDQVAVGEKLTSKH